MSRLEGAYLKSKSIRCAHCGSRAQFIRSLPDIRRGSGALKAYICVDCHKQTEIASE